MEHGRCTLSGAFGVLRIDRTRDESDSMNQGQSPAGGSVTNGPGVPEDGGGVKTITIDLPNGGHSQSVIDNQMIVTVMDDPRLIQTFADPQFQDLIWMANRSFDVPDVGLVLEARFESEQSRVIKWLAGRWRQSPYFLCIYPLAVGGRPYVLSVLLQPDTGPGPPFGCLMDCFARTEMTAKEQSERIRGKLWEFGLDGSRVSQVLVWSEELRDVRRELCLALLIGDTQDPLSQIRSNLTQSLQSVKQLQQSLDERDRDNSIDITSRSNMHLVSSLNELTARLRAAEDESLTALAAFAPGDDDAVYYSHAVPDYPAVLLRTFATIPYRDVLEVIRDTLDSLLTPIAVVGEDECSPSTSSETTGRRRRRASDETAGGPGTSRNANKRLKTTHGDDKPPRRSDVKESLQSWKETLDSGYTLHKKFSETCRRVRNSDDARPVHNRYTGEFVRVAERATAQVPERQWMIVAFLKLWQNIGRPAG